MSKQNPVPTNDAELDALVEQCEQCRADLCAPEPASFGAAPPQPKAIDPATILVILDVVLKLIAAWRAKK